MLQPVDPEELARLTLELAATSYHALLTGAVQARIATLQADDVTDPYVAMKRRGQVEELQRLLLPGFLQALALEGLSRRARAEAAASSVPVPSPRDWWVVPDDRPVP